MAWNSVSKKNKSMGEVADIVYVAVSQDVQESISTLLWALGNLIVKKICLVHIHRLPSLTPFSSLLEENEINEIQELEMLTSYESLHEYRDISTNTGVDEEDVDISMTSGSCVGEGIVELIYQNNINKLVMGAAADTHYSIGMSITSKKAEYVSQLAPHSCELWFICNGELIETRQGSFDLGSPLESFSSNSDEPHPDFFCPISTEIMRDPHMAADGYTYEGEQIRTWLNGGGETSPKTGLKLSNHNLTPNRTLRSIINDWLQQHPDYIVD